MSRSTRHNPSLLAAVDEHKRVIKDSLAKEAVTMHALDATFQELEENVENCIQEEGAKDVEQPEYSARPEETETPTTDYITCAEVQSMIAKERQRFAAMKYRKSIANIGE